MNREQGVGAPRGPNPSGFRRTECGAATATLSRRQKGQWSPVAVDFRRGSVVLPALRAPGLLSNGERRAAPRSVLSGNVPSPRSAVTEARPREARPTAANKLLFRHNCKRHAVQPDNQSPVRVPGPCRCFELILPERRSILGAFNASGAEESARRARRQWFSEQGELTSRIEMPSSF